MLPVPFVMAGFMLQEAIRANLPVSTAIMFIQFPSFVYALVLENILKLGSHSNITNYPIRFADWVLKQAIFNFNFSPGSH